jgi:hypothetical protein
MLRYMSEREKLQAMIREWNLIASSLKGTRKEAFECGFPALAETSDVAYKAVMEHMAVLIEMEDLLYSDEKKGGNVYNIFTKEVIA